MSKNKNKAGAPKKEKKAIKVTTSHQSHVWERFAETQDEAKKELKKSIYRMTGR